MWEATAMQIKRKYDHMQENTRVAANFFCIKKYHQIAKINQFSVAKFCNHIY